MEGSSERPRWGRVILVLMVFLVLWGLLQWLSRVLGADYRELVLLSYMVLFVAGAGIVLPLISGLRGGLELVQGRRGSLLWGSVVLVAAGTALGILGSGSLELLLADPPSFGVIVKYVLLFAPMSLAVALVSFWLVPLTVERSLGTGFLGGLAAILAGGAVCFLGFLVDGLFTDLSLAATLGLLGLIFSAALVLGGSFWLVYPPFAVVFLVNTLAAGRYDGESWWVLISGALAAVGALITVLRTRPETRD